MWGELGLVEGLVCRWDRLLYWMLSWLRRDIGIIKQMLNEGDVTLLAWCQGKDQLADVMTISVAEGVEKLGKLLKKEIADDLVLTNKQNKKV